MADFGRMVRHVLPPGEYDRRAMSPFAKLAFVININIIIIILISFKNADVHLCSMTQRCWHFCLHCKSLTTWNRRIRPLLWWSYSTQAASCM